MLEWHNESFDANTFANNYYGRPRLRDRRNDWALSLGGPVGIPKLKTFKDKWFFYAAYEKYKESYAGGGSPTTTVPVPEWWNGDLSRYLTNEVARDRRARQHRVSRRDLRPQHQTRS